MLDRAIQYFLCDLPVKQFKQGQKLYSENYYLIEAEKTAEASWIFHVPDDKTEWDYPVHINLDRRGFLKFDCDCFNFYENGNCKHAIAAALYLRDSKDEIPEAQNELSKVISIHPESSKTGWIC